MNIETIKELLLRYEIVKIGELIGCNQNEITEIEYLYNFKLPIFYKQFLSSMGKKAGLFYKGSEFFYPDLLELRSYANELLEEDGNCFVLPIDAFVFFFHQGYQFMYFIVDSDNQHLIYNYIQGDKEPTIAYLSLEDFFIKSIEEHYQILESIKGK